MRNLEYEKLADELRELQSDMRRLELASVAAVGATAAFLLTEKYGKDFLLFGATIPVLVTLTAALRYLTYLHQLRSMRAYLLRKEKAEGYDGWEQFMHDRRRSLASRLAIVSSVVFWGLLLLFSCGFFLAVIAYD